LSFRFNHDYVICQQNIAFERDLQSVALTLSGVAARVAALGGIDFPREVDADPAGVIILTELGTDIDAAVSRHLRIAGVEDVVGKDGYAEALVI